MALYLIEDKLKNKEIKKEVFQQIEKLAKENALKFDDNFLFKRNQYAELYFKSCYGNSVSKVEKDTCDRELAVYWDNSQKDPDTALKFISYINDSKSGLNKWPFFHSVITDQASPIFCKRPEVIDAILKKINEDAFSESTEIDYKKIVNNLVPEKCIKEVYPILKEILTSTDANGLDKELALSILLAQNQLTETEKDLYFTIYLFSGPVVGEKMNLAWKLIESLSENFKRREKIMAEISKIDYLSNKLFIDPNYPRNKAIIGHFAKNFPEMLNYYAENCLAFFKPDSTVYKVNSKTSCQTFFDVAKNIKNETRLNWISDSIETKYSALKK